jgi:hypothetical protein
MLPKATFDPADPQPLVDAALACPVCLYPSHWHAVSGPVLECTCTDCGHRHALEVTGAQLLRLTVPDDAADGLILDAGHNAGWPALL